MEYITIDRNASIDELKLKLNYLRVDRQRLLEEIEENKFHTQILQKYILDKEEQEKEDPKLRTLLDKDFWNVIHKAPGLGISIVGKMEDYILEHFEELFNYSYKGAYQGISVRELISLSGKQIMSISGIWYKRRYRIVDYLVSLGVPEYRINFRWGQ